MNNSYLNRRSFLKRIGLTAVSGTSALLLTSLIYSRRQTNFFNSSQESEMNEHHIKLEHKLFDQHVAEYYGFYKIQYNI